MKGAKILLGGDEGKDLSDCARNKHCSFQKGDL